MEKKNLTGTIIATIISLGTIVTLFSGFISNQAKLEVQLANIQKELTSISVKLDKRDEEIKLLTQRIIILEQRKSDK